MEGQAKNLSAPTLSLKEARSSHAHRIYALDTCRHAVD